MGSTVENQTSHVDPAEEEACLFAMQLAGSSVLPMVLQSAVELDLLEIIAKAGPGAYLSPSEVAAQFPTENPDAPVMIDRILRLLASHSILKCSIRELPGGGVERLYGPAPVCKYLSKNEDGATMSSILLMSNDKVMMESWYHIKDAVLEGGIPFNKAYGMNAYEYPNTDPRFNKVFNRGLADHSTIVMNKILETYKGFEGLGSIVDVGGGTGAILRSIVSKYPTIKGINFDLPHVIAVAPAFPGVEHVGGDMFVSVPKGDAIFLKALPDDGKVIIVEGIMPVSPDTDLVSKNVIDMDLIMLANTSGGKERTEKEFEALAKVAGFKGFRVAYSGFNPCVMEFLKNI